MAHLPVIAPPFTSHVRALDTFSSGLLARGHRVSWLHQVDVQPLLGDKRIEFHAVGSLSHPAGLLVRTVARAAQPGGTLGLRRVINDVAASTDMLCREAPALLAEVGCDMVIADQMEAAGGLVAADLGIPFVPVACALPINREFRLPLPVMPWGYARDAKCERLNEGSARVYDWLMQPHARVIARHAQAFGIGKRHTLADWLSPLAQISQTTASFDFLRSRPPAHFYPVGPLRPPLQQEPDLDLPIDASRPFVFASLGTLQGGQFGLFRRIAQACQALDAQLLLAHCDCLNASQAKVLRQYGATWVTGFAPRRVSLARADVPVSHAGLNTVLDALVAGTPLLALPIAFDQPGVAVRVVQAGAGLRLLPALATAATIEKNLRRLLSEPGFGQQARLLGAEVATSGGVTKAVEIVEAALSAGRSIQPLGVRHDACTTAADEAGRLQLA